MRRSDFDLDAIETAIRDALLGRGARALGQFMTSHGKALPGASVPCPKCQKPMRGTGPRAKSILTMLGKVSYARSRYVCRPCQQVRYPADESLDIAGTSRSPGVRRQVARLGAKETFEEVAQDLEELSGIQLSRKDAERISESVGADIERLNERERRRVLFQKTAGLEISKTIETMYVEMDGTGAPIVPWELEGRKGKQPDGSAKTREVKLGCVFTQTTLNEDGRPIRDPKSTTFTGAIEDSATFGWRIYAEATRRGLSNARRVVLIGDGATWISELANTHFPSALRIVDFYHAKEHVDALCKALFASQERVVQHRERWWEMLAQGTIETIVEEAQQSLPKDPNGNKDARREIAYLNKNKEHMRYRKFREQGLFIGSGVIEAACKTIIGKRLKQSGMEWTVRGANDIVALRCNVLSGRFPEYWEQRVA